MSLPPISIVYWTPFFTQPYNDGIYYIHSFIIIIITCIVTLHWLSRYKLGCVLLKTSWSRHWKRLLVHSNQQSVPCQRCSSHCLSRLWLQRQRCTRPCSGTAVDSNDHGVAHQSTLPTRWSQDAYLWVPCVIQLAESILYGILFTEYPQCSEPASTWNEQQNRR